MTVLQDMGRAANWRTIDVTWGTGVRQQHVLFKGKPWFTVAPSPIPGAGLGLFAARPFAAQRDLGVYLGTDIGPTNCPHPNGVAMDLRTPAGRAAWRAWRCGPHGKWVLAIHGRLIDGRKSPAGLQRMNDLRGRRNNARFKHTGTVCSTRRIRRGGEIFLSYGRGYWSFCDP